jgi:drug/metabolite transporter (DMT)-like permease
VPAERRGWGVGWWGVANNIATAIGPALAGWILVRRGVAVGFAAAGAAALLAGVASLFVRRIAPSEPRPAGSRTIVFTRSALPPAAVGAAMGFAHGAFFTFGPLLALRLGIADVGLYFATFAIAMIPSRVLLGGLSDRRSRSWAIVPGLAACTVAMALLVAIRDPAVAFVVPALFGIGSGAAMPGLVAWAVDRAGSDDRALALTTYYSLYETGIFAGATLLGVLIQGRSYDMLAVVSVVLAVALGGYLATQAPKTRARLALAAAVLLWGLVPVATRHLALAVGPFDVLKIRLVPYLIFFPPLLLRAHPRMWTRSTVAHAAFCGFLIVAGVHALLALGLWWLPAGFVGLILATEPILILLFSALWLRERPRAPVVVGLALAAAGVLTLARWPAVGAGQAATVWMGVAVVLVASVAFALYTVAIRPLSQRIGALPATTLSSVLGALPVLFFLDARFAASVAAWDPRTLGAALLASIGGSIIGTILWNWGVSRAPASEAGLFLYLVPLTTVLGGALLLGEPLGAATLGSALLILIGVGLAQGAWPRGRESKR